MEYQEFLKSKIKISEDYGFNVDMSEINPKLKPHNKLMVKWLVEGGKRACFASFGLHKTVTQLEAVRLTLAKVGSGSGLIVCPLSVRQEFVEDSKNILGWTIPPPNSFDAKKRWKVTASTLPITRASATAN